MIGVVILWGGGWEEIDEKSRDDDKLILCMKDLEYDVQLLIYPSRFSSFLLLVSPHNLRISRGTTATPPILKTMRRKTAETSLGALLGCESEIPQPGSLDPGR